METPAWIYVVSGALFVLVLWATWMVWDPLHRARPWLSLWWLELNSVVIFAPLVYMVTRILRLQSISLIDNVISAFGPMTPRSG